MILDPVNVSEKLNKAQSSLFKEQELLDEVYAILNNGTNSSSGIVKAPNTFDFDSLDHKAIYHISAIKKTCVDYRLRFLDAKLFKNNLPEEAELKIKKLENQHNTKLENLKIMAPSKLFRLKNPDDPLLFVPLGNDYYYLIHKWGNDLNPLRKLLVAPFKNFGNLLFASLVLSFFITCLVHVNELATTFSSGRFLILFLFMFKSVVGIVIYYAFSQGKNVSAEIWNSKYVK